MDKIVNKYLDLNLDHKLLIAQINLLENEIECRCKNILNNYFSKFYLQRTEEPFYYYDFLKCNVDIEIDSRYESIICQVEAAFCINDKIKLPIKKREAVSEFKSKIEDDYFRDDRRFKTPLFYIFRWNFENVERILNEQFNLSFSDDHSLKVIKFKNATNEQLSEMEIMRNILFKS